MIIKHPSNCECEYEFPHSVITTIRRVTISGSHFERVTTMVVCRNCDHWIDGKCKCDCAFYCHTESGGTDVATRALDMVD